MSFPGNTGLRLRICHLYPDLMNLYGDRGNIIALTRRALWRGIQAEVSAVGVGDRTDFSSFDIAFIGGGQDREQALIAEDFVRHKKGALVEAVEGGLVLLAVCGGYQLLGQYYRTAEGQTLPGVGLFDIWTEAGHKRMIGNVVIETDLWAEGKPRPEGRLRPGDRRTVVGFENHSGRTFLGKGVKPLGRVLIGHGNNGRDRQEGAVYRNAVGTYLHGSLLPKNPRLADWLLGRAIERRYGAAAVTRCLVPLDDRAEEEAHQAAIRRAEKTR